MLSLTSQWTERERERVYRTIEQAFIFPKIWVHRNTFLFQSLYFESCGDAENTILCRRTHTLSNEGHLNCHKSVFAFKDSTWKQTDMLYILIFLLRCSLYNKLCVEMTKCAPRLYLTSAFPQQNKSGLIGSTSVQ